MNTKHDKKIYFEKTPTYYKSLLAQARIKAMNATVKIINIGKTFKTKKIILIKEIPDHFGCLARVYSFRPCIL